MVKYFCDACGAETKSLNAFQYLCHLDVLAEGKLNYHVDSELNATSGRPVVAELCNKCYNEVVLASVVKLKDIQGGGA